MACFRSASPLCFLLLLDNDLSNGNEDSDDKDDDTTYDNVDELNHDDDVPMKFFIVI